MGENMHLMSLPQLTGHLPSDGRLGTPFGVTGKGNEQDFHGKGKSSFSPFLSLGGRWICKFLYPVPDSDGLGQRLVGTASLMDAGVVNWRNGLNPETRTGRYIRTLSSSMVLFASATLYSLGVVPLVLNYANASTLGLWILISQLWTWLGALDLGLSASSIRFFVGPIARKDSFALRSRFQACFFLAGLQGLIIILAGFLGHFFSQLFCIPADQRDLFEHLLLAQCIISGASFLSRPFASMLLAAQRFELNYLGNALSFVFSLAFAWWGLHLGWGLWSLMAGCFFQHALNIVLSIYGVHRMGFLRLLWGRHTHAWIDICTIVSESLSFAIGPISSMAIGVAQSVFLSRFFGLEWVAAWNVGAKAAIVLGQILSKFFESSFGGLSELLETGQRDRMFDRFGKILGWSLVTCALFCLGLIFLNDPFIALWAGEKIPWSVWGTWGVCLMLLVGTLHRAFSEATKILLLWNSIRFSPLLDLGALLASLAVAYWAGGFGSFVLAAALGPFFGGLLWNGRALRQAWGQGLWRLIPWNSLLCFVLLIFAGLLVVAVKLIGAK